MELKKNISSPELMGSYKKEDCIFLLTNINGKLKEQNTRQREYAMQNHGTHYSEMLPLEYLPKEEYMSVYHTALKESALVMAHYVGEVAELIYQAKGDKTVIVSLARAGTPIGVLIKRYLKYKYGVDIPHYSISIIRDKGLDENAMCYILQNHQAEGIQFVDGWTGKGIIGYTLKIACDKFYEKYGVAIDHSLAVLCDPGYCTHLYGTREDKLVPSACLNSTVSGLMSRTFLRDDIIGPDDFHGAKYYTEWTDIDLSNHFVDTISNEFVNVKILPQDLKDKAPASPLAAMQSINAILNEFGITSINRVKPGVGETTRVLLRRIPWKILVKDLNDANLKHILLLAKDRNVPVEVYPNMCYSCCGLIKDVTKE